MQKEYELLDFSPEFSEAFKELNLEWIEAYFEPEDIDLKMLSDPQKIFIDSGGAIVFAKVGEDIVGCCGLLKHNDRVFEISKMAVTSAHQGRGLGKAMLHQTLRIAKQLGATQLEIMSNTILEPAIGLYKSVGFVEIPLTSDAYDRGNISLRLDFLDSK
jgi:ribosomal protein S18 acetylase RimI-like enzyme